MEESDAANKAMDGQRVPAVATVSAAGVGVQKAKEEDTPHRVASTSAHESGLKSPGKRVHFIRKDGSFATGTRFIKARVEEGEASGGGQGE